MIQIKSVADQVLYTAETAADIREALQEAAKKGAYLGGANLRGAYLRGAYLRGAYLGGAYLRGAYLGGAYLGGADLGGAYLGGAYLRGAYLGGAYLGGAYLGGAYLRGADLGGAKGIAPERVTDLLMLLDQPGMIRAYKLVGVNGEGIYQGGFKYEIGKEIRVKDVDTDPNVQCGRGINLATLPWCLREWAPDRRVLVCEFEAKDIACIPTATDGKFRVSRCTVIEEKQIDPVALGLVVEKEAA